MNFVILGAGAVGCVVGSLLQADGHRVRYLGRASQAARLEPFVIERVANSRGCSALPLYLAPNEPLSDSDWIVVCVRGEQLDDAFADIRARAGAACSIAVAAISLDSVVERARRAGLTGTVLAYHISFGSFRDPAQPQHFTWFPFATPSTITPEGDRGSLTAARTLAKLIDHTGLRTRSVLSMRTSILSLVALNSVLALSWALCGWDLRRLVKNRELLEQTALALREALGVCGLQSGVLGRLSAVLPLVVYRWVLHGLARFMGASGRQVWLHHGPKISTQTDYVVRELLARAQLATLPVSALPRLFARWQAAQTDAADPTGAEAQGAALPVT